MVRFFDYLVAYRDLSGSDKVMIVPSQPSKFHVRDFMQHCYPDYEVFGIVKLHPAFFKSV